MEHVFLNSLEKGKTFSGVYFVHEIYEKVARNGNLYTDLQIGDSTGYKFARYWGKVKNEIEKKSWVAINARVEEYNGKLQIVTQKIEEADKPSDLSNYILESENIEVNISKFEKFIDRIRDLGEKTSDMTCSFIIDKIFTDEFKEIFFKSAYNTNYTYGKIGGLLENTTNCVYIMGGFAKNYGFSDYETMIGITATILHGIGATEVYEFSGCLCEETVKGRLYGCKNMTLNHINKVISNINKFEGYNEYTETRLLHALETFDNSLILPMTKEAILLSEVMKIDLKLTSAIDFIANDKNEDDFTAYDSLNKRHYYK